MYRVRLGNGKVIECEVSGSTLLTEAEIDRAELESGLRLGVNVEAAGESEDAEPYELAGEHEALLLTGIFRIGKRTGLTLGRVPELTSAERLRADIDYLLLLSEEA